MSISGRKRKIIEGVHDNGSSIPVNHTSASVLKKSRRKSQKILLENAHSAAVKPNKRSQSPTSCSSDSEGDTNEEPSPGHGSRFKQRENRRIVREKLRRTLFVGNLPAGITRKELKRLFNAKLKSEGIEDASRVESVRLRGVVSATGGIGKMGKKRAVLQKEFTAGISPTILAYVVLKSSVGIQAALKLNGQWLEGDIITREVHSDQQHHPEPGQGRFIRVDSAVSENASKSAGNTVFLGNLPFNIQEDDLRTVMSNFGQISNIRLIRDKVTGAVKGIGFIEFSDLSGASLAIRSSGTVSVQGRPMRIEELKTAKKNDAKVKSPRLSSSKTSVKPAKVRATSAPKRSIPKIDQKGIFKGITVPSNLRGPQRERYLQKRLLKKKKRQIRRQSNSEPPRTKAPPASAK